MEESKDGTSNVVDLTISPIKKELDLHVGNDDRLMEECKVTFVVVVHMEPFISKKNASFTSNTCTCIVSFDKYR